MTHQCTQIETNAHKKWNEHEDGRRVDPFQIPVIIYGSKYDIFGSDDLEKMKWLCRGLRFFAHQNGCDLVMGSNKEKAMTDAKIILYNHLGLTTRAAKDQFDHS